MLQIALPSKVHPGNTQKRLKATRGASHQGSVPNFGRHLAMERGSPHP